MKDSKATHENFYPSFYKGIIFKLALLGLEFPGRSDVFYASRFL